MKYSFQKFTVELIIYGFLLFLEMLSGYLDDGSKIPWSDYKKGLIVDGIAGLIKIFLKRFFKISVLKNTRTPIHDEMRKNRGWSDTQVVNRFTIIQIVAVEILFVIES